MRYGLTFVIVAVQSVDVLWLFTTSPTCAFAPRSRSIEPTKVQGVPLSERKPSSNTPKNGGAGGRQNT